MPDLLHKLKPKILDNDSQNCFKPLPTAEKTLACPDFYKGLIVEIVGDNAVSSALSSDKYSLEMNTTCKSDHLCLARGAIENEIHIAQKKQFLALSPFLGYEAIYMMQIVTLYVQIFCICIKYYVRMVDIIMRAYKYLSIHS